MKKRVRFIDEVEGKVIMHSSVHELPHVLLKAYLSLSGNPQEKQQASKVRAHYNRDKDTWQCLV
jgi:hypothetical protein